MIAILWGLLNDEIDNNTSGIPESFHCEPVSVFLVDTRHRNRFVPAPQVIYAMGIDCACQTT